MLFPPFNGINLHPSMVLNPRCYKFNFRCFSKCPFSPCFTLKNIPGPCSFLLSPYPFPDMWQLWYLLYAVEHLLSGHLQPATPIGRPAIKVLMRILLLVLYPLLKATRPLQPAFPLLDNVDDITNTNSSVHII